MKKNLLSILILALLLVNTVMTGVMMFTVMSTNNQATQLIADIAAALEIKANGSQNFSSSASGNVDIANVATFSISGDDEMTIALKMGEDGTQHYALVDLVLSMDSSHADYATYGTEEALTANMDLLKAKIQEVISSHTAEEVKADEASIRKEILEALQEMYGSSFIYDVSFSQILVQ